MTDELTEAVARAICCRGGQCRTADGACVMDPVHYELATAAIAAVRAHDAAQGYRLVKREPVRWMYEHPVFGCSIYRSRQEIKCLNANTVETPLFAAINGED